MRNRRSFKVLLAVAVSAAGLIPAVGAGATTSDVHTVPSGSLAGLRYHVVVAGDSVSSIARTYGVDASTIRIGNGLVGDDLYLGARVLIDPANPSLLRGSGPDTSSSAAATGAAGTYVVKEGDMLERIARKAGVKLSSLLSANGLEPTSTILPGRKLTVPADSSARASSTRASATSTSSDTSSSGSTSTSSSWVGPRLVCPVPGATFMNDWGFPRGSERFHEGTDMFAPVGTTILAPVSGLVSFGSNNLGGTTFNITTADGWNIYGAHLSDTIGSGGQVVAGTPIGRVGNSGDADGGDTHLHLGVKPAGGRPANAYPSVLSACG